MQFLQFAQNNRNYTFQDMQHGGKIEHFQRTERESIFM